jgi:hypothetical protein
MKLRVLVIMMTIALGVTSCDIGDDDSGRPIQFEVVPVTSVDIPDTFEFGEINEVIVRYNRPSDCHRFEGFNVQSNLNEREVRVVTSFVSDDDCSDTVVPEEQTLRFRATSNGTYLFKFFTGLDDDGVPQFEEYEVTVEE